MMGRQRCRLAPVLSVMLAAILIVCALGSGQATASITEIIDATGDGVGNGLSFPVGIAVDAVGNTYVAGTGSHNAFKITPAGVITEIISAIGDCTNGLGVPSGIALDATGNVYVAGRGSNNAFKITPAGVITEIISAIGDCTNGLGVPSGIALDATGNVYVTGRGSNNAFKITSPGSPDCNDNCIPDATDIADGTSQDCNANGIPDDCDASAVVTTTTLDAVNRGWWSDIYFHDSTNNSPFTGLDEEVATAILNSYFIFDVSAAASVDSLTLRLEIEEYFSFDAAESLTVYDVSTDAETLEASGMDVNIFNDLQSGSAYATFTVTPDDMGKVLEIPLNAQAASDIAASSGFFSVGVHLSSLDPLRTDQLEGVRFSRANEQRVHQLVLSTFDNDCNADGIPDGCEIDCNANGIPDDCETCGDLDGDGDVDADDFEIFLGAFGLGVGAVGFEPCADADGDGVVTFVDYQQWLECYRSFVGNPLAPPPMPEGVGDMDGSGGVDGSDIQPFVDALLEPATAGFRERFMADANGDGAVDSADVGEFVGLLLSQ